MKSRKLEKKESKMPCNYIKTCEKTVTKEYARNTCLAEAGTKECARAILFEKKPRDWTLEIQEDEANRR